MEIIGGYIVSASNWKEVTDGRRVTKQLARRAEDDVRPARQQMNNTSPPSHASTSGGAVSSTNHPRKTASGVRMNNSSIKHEYRAPVSVVDTYPQHHGLPSTAAPGYRAAEVTNDSSCAQREYRAPASVVESYRRSAGVVAATCSQIWWPYDDDDDAQYSTKPADAPYHGVVNTSARGQWAAELQANGFTSLWTDPLKQLNDEESCRSEDQAQDHGVAPAADAAGIGAKDADGKDVNAVKVTPWAEINARFEESIRELDIFLQQQDSDSL